MLRVLPTLIEPERWTLAFHRTSPYWWVRWLACGRYQHVSAFAYVSDLDLWLYYDVTLGGTKLLLLPDSHAAVAWLCNRTADADLLNFNVDKSDQQVWRKNRHWPIIAPFYCCSAIKSLIGLRSSALRPDGLYRDVMAAGAETVDGTARSQDRPVHHRAATSGAAGSH